MTFKLVFEQLNFMAGLILAQGVMCHRLPRRKHFALRVCAVCAVLLIVALFWPHSFPSFSRTAARWATAFGFIMQFLLTCGGVALCFRADVWSYLFCGTAAYCLQHVAYQTHSIVLEFIMLPQYGKVILLALMYAAIFTGAYFLLVRRRLNRNEPIEVNNKMQILVATCLLAVTVFISFFGAIYSFEFSRPGVNVMLIIVCLFSDMCCVLGLCTEFGLFAIHKAESELQVVQRLLHSKKEQYEISKENIELINRKCHDLKHQLRTLKGKIDEDELDEIAGAVDIYERILKTGNDALDVVLTEKSLHCYSKKIRLTCLLDGTRIAHIPARDLYSMFGNALQNAMESVETLPEEKRVVSITGIVQGQTLDVKIENYFSGNMRFENGLPVTTKKNNFYHGFGMKSMKMIAEKYGGRLEAHANGDVFTLDVFLPVSDFAAPVDEENAVYAGRKKKGAIKRKNASGGIGNGAACYAETPVETGGLQ